MFTRREMIHALGAGLGSVSLAALLAREAGAAPHFEPKTKRIIQLFMNGGPFQGDFFDPKPALNKYAGQRPKAVDLRTENKTGGLMAVPFKYRRCGKSGLAIEPCESALRARLWRADLTDSHAKNFKDETRDNRTACRL